jgi:hypothetical protein
MTMLDSSDPRFAKALALADKAASWPKIRAKDGRCVAVGVPASQPNHFYRVTRTTVAHRQACCTTSSGRMSTETAWLPA